MDPSDTLLREDHSVSDGTRDGRDAAPEKDAHPIVIVSRTWKTRVLPRHPRRGDAKVEIAVESLDFSPT